jgi:hypothetical protein
MVILGFRGCGDQDYIAANPPLEPKASLLLNQRFRFSGSAA